MNESSILPVRESIIWASLLVPSVVTTNAWVSPRVNNAEPWVLGKTPVWTLIGLTVLESLPSILFSPDRIRSLTMSFLRLSKTLEIVSELSSSSFSWFFMTSSFRSDNF